MQPIVESLQIDDFFFNQENNSAFIEKWSGKVVDVIASA